MFEFYILAFYCVPEIVSLPTNHLRRIAEGHFDDFENNSPKFDDLPYYQQTTNDVEDDFILKFNKIIENMDKGERAINETTNDNSSLSPETERPTTNFTQGLSNVTLQADNNRSLDTTYRQLESISDYSSSELNETSRSPRQGSNDTENDPEFENQQDDSSEEDQNMLTGLLGTFLGGFSRPDGSIDLDAILGILGSLSSQREDGTYEFQGLTDLLRGFFGGGGDEGGGSDIGAFAGGLLAAIIKGLANPPGAKGAGILTGKVVAGVLPALSGPAPADDNPPPEGLDSGGFLSGLLKTILGSSSGGGQGQGGGSKYTIFKTIISLVTSIFGSSSTSH